MDSQYSFRSSLGAKSSGRNFSAYSDAGETLVPSVCALIDILGFSQAVKDATSAGSARNLLRNLLAALETSLNSIDKTKVDDNYWVHKFFTDNLVIAHLEKPSKGFPSELSLAMTIRISATHQLAMALNGFPVRGAITRGDLFVDHNIVIGAPLVQAHELENCRSAGRFPRIILSKECENIAMTDSDFGDSILRDVDATLFVNYLDWTWWDQYNPELGHDILARHKRFVERGLSEYQGIRGVYDKYLWLAQYHNYFCNNTANEWHYLDNPPELTIQNVPGRTFAAISDDEYKVATLAAYNRMQGDK